MKTNKNQVVPYLYVLFFQQVPGCWNHNTQIKPVLRVYLLVIVGPTITFLLALVNLYKSFQKSQCCLGKKSKQTDFNYLTYV